MQFLKCALLALSFAFVFTPAASAEIVTTQGEGFYFMGEDETVAVAQERAKNHALRNALETIVLMITSRTEDKDAHLSQDEITAIAAGTLKVIDTKYELSIAKDNMTNVTAIVTATVDTDEVETAIEKERKRHTDGK